MNRLLPVALAGLCLVSVLALHGCPKESHPTAPARLAPRRVEVHRPPAPPPTATRPRPPVVLELEQASISWSAGTLTVDCRVLLVNRTGAALVVLTNFLSAFDGFTVTVRGPHGGLVARQSYVAHQSPFAQNRPVQVLPGETQDTLRFPIPLAATPSRPLEVQLTGGLPGTHFSRNIRSNIVVVR